MFLARCENLGRDALIWVSDVDSIINTDQGMIVRYKCICGEMAEMLTGTGSEVHVSLHVGHEAA
ncbi:MAG: hypothetical protein ACRDWS_14970 [Acidimicrobiia bacterium]